MRLTWLSRVRLPYQHRRLKTCTKRPEGGGPTCDRPPAAGDRRRRGFRAIRPMGRNSAESALNWYAAVTWQHDRVPCSAWIPLPPASGKRQRMSGDSPRGFAQRRRARRKLPCRRRLCGCLNDTPHLYV